MAHFLSAQQAPLNDNLTQNKATSLAKKKAGSGVQQISSPDNYVNVFSSPELEFKTYLNRRDTT